MRHDRISGAAGRTLQGIMINALIVIPIQVEPKSIVSTSRKYPTRHEMRKMRYHSKRVYKNEPVIARGKDGAKVSN